jgi:hypothetical protein
LIYFKCPLPIFTLFNLIHHPNPSIYSLSALVFTITSEVKRKLHSNFSLSIFQFSLFCSISIELFANWTIFFYKKHCSINQRFSSKCSLFSLFKKKSFICCNDQLSTTILLLLRIKWEKDKMRNKIGIFRLKIVLWGLLHCARKKMILNHLSHQHYYLIIRLWSALGGL